MPLSTVQNLKKISLARDVFLKYWETTLKTLGKHWELANKTLGLTPCQPVATLYTPFFYKQQEQIETLVLLIFSENRDSRVAYFGA